MSYSQEVYTRATEILERRRERANLEAQDRIDEVSEKLPEISTIQQKLAQIGLSISKVFLYSTDKCSTPALPARIQALSAADAASATMKS